MDPSEDSAPRGHRQPAGDRPGTPERGGLALPLDLANEACPEHLEELRDEDHRRRPVRADRLEHHPRVAGPDVEDVGAEVEEEVKPDGLLEEMGQREHRHHPILDLRDEVVEPVDPRDRVLVGQDDSLRGAGRA